MKICFFSDIHGNGSAFHAFVKRMEIEQPDKIIFGGDFFGYYYDALEILHEMQELQYTCIRGNHDQMMLDCKEDPSILHQTHDLSRLEGRYGSSYQQAFQQISKEDLDFLHDLPEKLEMMVDRIKIGFFHGSPRNPLLDRIYPDTVIEDTSAFEPYDYVFCGHTHHKLVKQIGHTWLINPGSAGQQRDGKGTSYVVFDTQKRIFRIQSFAYDCKVVEQQIEEYEKNTPDMARKLKEVLYRQNVR